MKALICKNCGAADWKEENGYQICTYCGTKIPLSEDEQCSNQKEITYDKNIVGTWTASIGEETYTLIIDEDLTGLLTIEYAPQRIKSKNLDFYHSDINVIANILKIKGYVQSVSRKIHLISKNVKKFSIVVHNIRIDCQDKNFFNSTSKEAYEYNNIDETEVGTITLLSKESINVVINTINGDEELLLTKTV